VGVREIGQRRAGHRSLEGRLFLFDGRGQLGKSQLVSRNASLEVLSNALPLGSSHSAHREGIDPSKANNEIGRSRQAGPGLTTELSDEDLVPKLSSEKNRATESE
jgi:hypothetical protein